MKDLEHAKYIILQESNDLKALAESLDENFSKACQIMRECIGHIIVTGMGKSGHIGNKLAATFASTGTPSFFLHPAEASHGDLGMITPNNIVIAISNSGESKEIFDLLEYCKRNGIKIIGITSKKNSTLGNYSDVTLVYPLEREACYLNLAPTSSTIMSLALGDALAVALYQSKNFGKTDFGNFHPGGKLGKTLIKVSDVMCEHSSMAIVKSGTSVKESILSMTAHIGGCVFVIDDNMKLLGVFTDGDLRRHLLEDILHSTIDELMTTAPQSCSPTILASDAMHIMNEKRITVLPVVEKGALVGMIHMHDLVRLGL